MFQNAMRVVAVPVKSSSMGFYLPVEVEEGIFEGHRERRRDTNTLVRLFYSTLLKRE